MTDQIVAVQQIDGNLWVDARTLHANLEVGRIFAHWIKSRLSACGAIEGEDFLPLLTKSVGGRPAVEYLLSLDLGKEFAMLEKNDKGREIRRHFIAAEKELRAIKESAPVLSHLEILAQMARSLADNEKLMLQSIELSTQTAVKTGALEQRLDEMPMDSEKRGQIYKLGQEFAHLLGGERSDFAKVWRMFKERFGLAAYSSLPNSRFEEALEFLRLQISAYTKPKAA